MDAYLAIASRREVREYADRPVPADVERRILDAGRVTGSAGNWQPWTFLVVRDPEARERVADAVWEPDNVRGAALVVAISVAGKGPLGFDAGRVSQNMLLAAWSEGVGACPNTTPDRAKLATALGLAADAQVPVVLTFGYPARARDPERRTAEEWIVRARRRPFDEVVQVV